MNTGARRVPIRAVVSSAKRARETWAAVAEGASHVVVADLNGAVTIQGMDAYRAKYVQVFGDFPPSGLDRGLRVEPGSRLSGTAVGVYPDVSLKQARDRRDERTIR